MTCGGARSAPLRRSSLRAPSPWCVLITALPALPAAELPADRPVLQGRKPPGRDIRLTLAPPRPAAERLASDDARPAGSQAAKRQKRRDYETQVHTIRIGADGSINETRGVVPLHGEPGVL